VGQGKISHYTSRFLASLPKYGTILAMHKVIARHDLEKIVLEERLADVTDTIARAEAG
jgi:hypothetical protein